MCGLSLYHIVRFWAVKGIQDQREEKEIEKESSGGTGQKDQEMGKQHRRDSRQGKKGE